MFCKILTRIKMQCILLVIVWIAVLFSAKVKASTTTSNPGTTDLNISSNNTKKTINLATTTNAITNIIAQTNCSISVKQNLKTIFNSKYTSISQATSMRSVTDVSNFTSSRERSITQTRLVQTNTKHLSNHPTNYFITSPYLLTKTEKITISNPDNRTDLVDMADTTSSSPTSRQISQTTGMNTFSAQTDHSTNSDTIATTVPSSTSIQVTTTESVTDVSTPSLLLATGQESTALQVDLVQTNNSTNTPSSLTTNEIITISQSPPSIIITTSSNSVTSELETISSVHPSSLTTGFSVSVNQTEPSLLHANQSITPLSATTTTISTTSDFGLSTDSTNATNTIVKTVSDMSSHSMPSTAILTEKSTTFGTISMPNNLHDVSMSTNTISSIRDNRTDLVNMADTTSSSPTSRQISQTTGMNAFSAQTDHSTNSDTIATTEPSSTSIQVTTTESVTDVSTPSLLLAASQKSTSTQTNFVQSTVKTAFVFSTYSSTISHSTLSINDANTSQSKSSCPAVEYNHDNITLNFPQISLGRTAVSDNSCENGRPKSSRFCTNGGIWMEPTIIECNLTEEEILELLENETTSNAVDLVFLLTTTNDFAGVNITSLLSSLNFKIDGENLTTSENVETVIQIFENVANNRDNSLTLNSTSELVKLLETTTFKEELNLYDVVTRSTGLITTRLGYLPLNCTINNYEIKITRNNNQTAHIVIPNVNLSNLSCDVVKILVILFPSSLFKTASTEFTESSIRGDAVLISIGNKFNPTDIQDLKEPIIITWNLQSEIERERSSANVDQQKQLRIEPTCAYYDEDKQNFSQEGLRVSNVSESSPEQSCETNHLTTFVIFAEIMFVDVIQNNSLSLMIVKISNLILIFGLLLSTIIYIVVKVTRRDLIGHVIIQICFSASTGTVIYLISSETWNSLNSTNCFILALFYNFATLLTFLWIAWFAFITEKSTEKPLQWIANYQNLTCAQRYKKMIKWNIAAYIAIGILSGISAAFSFVSKEENRKEKFANTNSCISQGYALYYGLGIPLVTMYLVALFYGIRAVKSISVNYAEVKIRFLTYEHVLSDVKFMVEFMAVTALLFGVIWSLSIARLNIGDPTTNQNLTVDYSLIVMNIFTAVVIPLFLCLRPGRVRQELMHAVSCKHYFTKRQSSYNVNDDEIVTPDEIRMKHVTSYRENKDSEGQRAETCLYKPYPVLKLTTFNETNELRDIRRSSEIMPRPMALSMLTQAGDRNKNEQDLSDEEETPKYLI